MKISTKKMAFAGLAAIAALVGTLVVSVFPVYAAPPTPPANGISMDMERVGTVSIPNGGSFSITLNVNPGTVISRGFQAAVEFPTGTLTTTRANIAMGSYWSDAANADPSGQAFMTTPNPLITTSNVLIGTTISGNPGYGPTGNGTPFVAATIIFTATAAANNSMIPLTFGTSGAQSSYVTGSDSVTALPSTLGGTLNIVIGTLPALSVSSISTNPANGSSANYSLNFTVTDANAAAAASTVSYTINGGTAVTQSVNALAVGGHQDFSIPLTVSSSGTDAIVVTADAGNLYGESNNTRSISYTILPDLVVSAVSTSPDGHDINNPSTVQQYTISYTITNNGPGAAAASNTSIVINSNSTPIVIACPALASGAFNSQTTAVQTVNGIQDNITVNADYQNVVHEWTENNNSASTTYYFKSPGITQHNDVSGNITTVEQFTGPNDVTSWTYSGNTGTPSPFFFPGQLNVNAVTNTMNVTSNVMWSVQVSGQNGGYLTKYNGSTYDTTVKLSNMLLVIAGSNQGSLGYYVNVATPQTLATGDPTGLNGVTGYSRDIPVTFNQNVLFSDKALATGYNYHMTVTYICTFNGY